VEVERVADLPAALRRAATLALTPPTGPVFLSLPMDLQMETAELNLAPIVYPDQRTRPPQAALERAAAVLLLAKNPAILVGSRVVEADAVAELVAIAEALGAPVYSEPGHGTTFKIYLPRADEQSPARKPDAARPAARGTETILVVEDEGGVRMLIRAILEVNGYRVLEAARGREALDILAQNPSAVALMITDVVMPEMSGRELAERARTVAPDMKVLFISGYTDEAIVQHGVLRPGIPFLQKPFTHEALAQKIRSLLDGADSAAHSA
jgi:thiamine pyrophosphate-dependent acetolactate synthase large subunit-like protein